MWARQVSGCSPEVIEQFFTEWMTAHHFMPAYVDWTEWMESRAEQQRYRNGEYWENYQRKVNEVMDWQRSPEYESELATIRECLTRIVESAQKLMPPKPKFEIPLAFTPEREREILAEYAAKARKM
jgi:hypothetical protein